MPFPPFPDTPRDQSPERFHVKKFRGANQNAPRASVGNEQFSWLENLMPIQEGNLRGMYAEDTNKYTAPGGKTIINVFYFNVGSAQQAIAFLSDGTAEQFSPVSGAKVTVSNVGGTFYDGSYLPVAAQWNAQGIVITTSVAADKNRYWSWDGTTLTAPGATAPTWLTNSAVTTMPSGVYGNAIEVYQNRVWIAQPPSATPPLIPASVNVSAPSNGADFLTADGSNVTPQQDSSLRYVFNALRQSNGFLYPVGDSNISAISNVLTSGSPPLTSYSNQNINPQVGTAWQNTCQLFEQALIFANPQGVYILNGGVVQKISKDLDGLFAKASFATVPSACVAIIFGVKVYCLLLNVLDYAGIQRNVICIWNGQDWFFASTINTGTNAVYGQEFNSNLIAWGCDGTHIYKLFQVASSSLSKIFQTKLYSGGQTDDGWITYKKQYRFYFLAFDYSGGGITFTGTMDSELSSLPLTVATTAAFFEFTNSSLAVIHFQNASLSTILWGVKNAALTGSDISQYGRLLGCTESVVGVDFSIVAFAIEFSYDATFLG